MNTNNDVKWRRCIVPEKVEQINDHLLCTIIINSLKCYCSIVLSFIFYLGLLSSVYSMTGCLTSWRTWMTAEDIIYREILIPVAALIASSSNGCSSSLLYIQSPAECSNTRTRHGRTSYGQRHYRHSFVNNVVFPAAVVAEFIVANSLLFTTFCWPTIHLASMSFSTVLLRSDTQNAIIVRWQGEI